MAQRDELGVQALPWVVDRKHATLDSDLLWDEFSRIYEQCFPVVLWFTVSRVGNPRIAEDLVAETFERAMHAWPSFRRESTACSWVLGIARHVIAAHWKNADREPLLLDHLPSSRQPSLVTTPEDLVQKRDDLERLSRAIAQLTESERDMIALRYAANLPFSEIASTLRTREGTARVRVHRTLRRLRLLLEGESC